MCKVTPVIYTGLHPHNEAGSAEGLGIRVQGSEIPPLHMMDHELMRTGLYRIKQIG